MTIKDIKLCFYYISIGDNTGRKLVAFEANWDKVQKSLRSVGAIYEPN